jgi:hypothetical protein
MKTGHVYLLTHVPSGRKYVGKTTQPIAADRWKQHCAAAVSGNHRPLRVAIREHGWEAFSAEVIWTGPVDELAAKEAHYIAQHGSVFPAGYNATAASGDSRPPRPAAAPQEPHPVLTLNAAGLDPRQFAAALNDNRTLPPRGGLWSDKMVRRVLRSAGIYRSGRAI